MTTPKLYTQTSGTPVMICSMQNQRIYIPCVYLVWQEYLANFHPYLHPLVIRLLCLYRNSQ